MLLVDLDPQSNLTEAFGLLDEREPEIGDLLADPGRAGAEAVVRARPASRAHTELGRGSPT